jgi:hypothetical protein
MIELDPLRDASHLRMIAHLAGPFAGGAVDNPVPLVGGAAVVDWAAREPLLLCASKAAVGAVGFQVTI